jgi:hypothetical protein
MTCQDYELEIGDYVDGTLSHERVPALEGHLASCARCRAIATDFRALRSAVSVLERKSPPPQVWTRVAAQLTAERPQAQGRWAWLPVGLSWRPAAAAAVVVALLAGGTWVAWREVSTPQSSRNVQAGPPDVQDAAAGTRLLMPDQELTQQINHLEGIVTADQAVLPDETKAVYRATGAVIDNAIGESRAVLKTEPSNDLAQESLFEALRSKLALLQDMVALINEMRKGNQEGAARIVSGMEP